MDQLLLTSEEAANLFRVSPTDVVTLVEKGELAGFQIAGKWRIALASSGAKLNQTLISQGSLLMEPFR